MEGRYIPTWDGVFHRINIRFIGFPNRIRIKELNSKMLDKFCSLRVVVRKATTVKPKIIKAAYKCNACKQKIAYTPVENEEVIPPTDKCLCGGRSWRFVLKESIKKDYQIIEVQEPPEEGAETNAEKITIKLLDDLTGLVQPGNIIIVNGIFKADQEGTKNATLTTYIEAKSIEVTNKDFSKIEINPEEILEFKQMANDPDIFNILHQSIARIIKGHTHVKQGILLQLMGGVEKITDDGDRIRGDNNLLLCGDPATAKSKMLKAAYNLCPRGIYASGKSTTGPGLTASVSKGLDGCWQIEAGAAVLANNGNLFLDEMDKMPKDAVLALHEIAEDQIIHLNKAGINADLPAKCTLTAACNPKRSRFNEYEDLASQVNFPASLLSRFGLIFLILDKPDPKKDREIAEHLMSYHRKKNTVGKISTAKLRRYIAYAKFVS